MSTKTLVEPAVNDLTGKDALGIVVVLLFATPAVFPLLSEGLLPTHDGAFHLFRLMALDSALHSGVLYPRLFPDFAFGYGYPVLNFYSPATYYLAELFHLTGLGYIDSTKLMMASTLALSGVFMYLWTAGVFGRLPALLSATAYLYFPYHLADAYVRGAFPEFAALALYPALLWTYHRLFRAARPVVWLPLASLTTALLILTHNLSAVIFAPVLIGYILLLAVLEKSRGRLLLSGASLALAVGIAAFFWLPSSAEMKWVQIGQEIGTATAGGKHLYSLGDYLSPFNLYRYLPDQGTAAEFPFGRIQVFVLATSLASLWHVRRRSHLAFMYAGYFVFVTVVAIFMLLPPSVGLWAITRLQTSLQYPWRLQSLLVLSTSFLAGAIVFVISRPRTEAGIRSLGPMTRTVPLWRRPAVLGALVAVALGGAILLSGLVHLPAGDTKIQEGAVNVEKMWADDARANQIGATWTAEFLPVSVKEERWRIPRGDPGALAQPASPWSPPRVRLARSGGWSWHYALDAAQASKLRSHAFYLPGWRAFVDGQAIDTYPTGSLGLVEFEVPAGRHEIRLEFGSTAARQLGVLLTLVSVVALIVITALKVPRRASVALLIGLAAVGAFSATHFFPQPAMAITPLDANLQNVARLIGFETDKQSYRPGDTIRLKLYWLAWEIGGKDYKVFVHVSSGPGTPPVAQHDGDPVGGFTPTSRWASGEMLADQHEVVLPAFLSPGSYPLEVGMYDPASLRNLAVVDEEGKQIGERVFLGEVRVVQP